VQLNRKRCVGWESDVDFGIGGVQLDGDTLRFVGCLQKANFELGAVMEDLSQFGCGARVAVGFDFDCGEAVKRRAKRNVKRRDAVAGFELGQKCGVNIVGAVGGAEANDSLQLQIRVSWVDRDAPISARCEPFHHMARANRYGDARYNTKRGDRCAELPTLGGHEVVLSFRGELELGACVIAWEN
jgi:hypothetical protein